MSRNCLLAAVLVVLVAAVALVVKTVLSRPERYNVLLITLDTTRADRLGCYGYEQALTPALDELAAKGVLFEQAFCSAPITLPSHATMLTGLQPPEHGLRVNGEGRLRPEIPTLASILGERGYATGAFIAAIVLDSKFGLERGFETYDDDLSHAYAQKIDLAMQKYRGGDLVTDAALAWLEKQDARPFFCWVHLYDPHTPYYPHEALSGTRFAAQRSYDAEVAFMDMQVARLTAFLERRNLLQRTLVIAAGDHGEGLGQHDEDEHGFMLYDATLHVPLVFSLPGTIDEGQRVRSGVSLVDLFPTLLDFLDVPSTPPERLGRSLAPALLGEDIDSFPCYAMTDMPYAHFGWTPLRSLATDQWKYIRAPRVELYDRRADPKELHNLADDREETVQELEITLATLQAEMVPQEAQQVTLTADERRRLAAIGYVGGGRSVDVDVDSLDLSLLKDVKDMRPVIRMELKYLELANEGKTLEAVQVAREMARLDPDALVIRLLLADALRDNHQPAEAVREYRAALRIEPDHAKTHANLGVVLGQQGQLEEAMTHLNEAIRLDPDDDAAHGNAGYTLFKLGRLEDAVARYTEALRLNPENKRATTNLAIALLKRGRTDEAIPLFAKNLGADADDPTKHFHRANALLQQGKTDRAVGHYLVALDLKPDFAEAHNNLAVAFLQQGSVDKAIVHCREAVRLKPDYADAHANLALGLTQRGKTDEAIREYRAALEIRPHNAGTHCDLGDLLSAQGKRDEAIRAYREALRLDPDHERAAEALQAELARQATTTTAAGRDNNWLTLVSSGWHVFCEAR